MTPDQTQKNATIVLVHAAWTDGSSWNKVTSELRRSGFDVVAAQIPLTSLSDDVTALRRVLRRQDNPVILAGHSYGGAVITAAGSDNPNVKGLVYVAAIVPDEGETVGDVFHRVAPHPSAPKLQPDGDGLLWLQLDGFRSAVARKEKPSWFLIAEKDRMVSPDTQRFTADRMKSKSVSLPVDHFPLLSRPTAVVDLINEAAAGV